MCKFCKITAKLSSITFSPEFEIKCLISSIVLLSPFNLLFFSLAFDKEVSSCAFPLLISFFITNLSYHTLTWVQN